jgi:ferredoxin/flavodoxin---NADP+ reductase
LFRIRKAEFIAPEVKRFVLDAPAIARKRKAGQFVIVRLHDGGERIPLTLVDSDSASGTIELVVQGVGKTTREMNRLESEDSILDVVGPLGQPSEVAFYGTAVTIGGGVGAAIAFPVTVALKQAGNHVISILGARSKDLVILEKELKAVADQVIVTTDDGSYGEHGLVTDSLQRMLASGRKIDYVMAIGPIPMMKAVAETTRPYGIKTIVSLNPIMVDGTGMCGGCRAVVGDQTVFVCVDGPEFDAHLVDFDLLHQRNKAYRTFEHQAMERMNCKQGEIGRRTEN